MAVDNHLIMLAGIDRNRSFVSLVQAQPLVFLSDTALPKDGMGLAIINDKALVDVGDEHSELFGAAQLLAFDLQDPANITQIEVIDLAFSDNHRVPILSINSHVILANGAGGVEVFKYSH